jgi:hypothetical protein
MLLVIRKAEVLFVRRRDDYSELMCVSGAVAGGGVNVIKTPRLEQNPIYLPSALGWAREKDVITFQQNTVPHNSPSIPRWIFDCLKFQIAVSVLRCLRPHEEKHILNKILYRIFQKECYHFKLI